VCENRLLRKIFGPEREEGQGTWRKLQNKELHNLHASTEIIRVIKPRRVRWAGLVELMGEMRNT
jgi:hypothetical protein